MAKTRVQKQKTLDSLADGIKNAKSVVFANFQGLKVKETEELRGLCRKQNVTYMASKKTLVQKAMKDAGLDTDIKSFGGGVSALFGKEDEVAPAQLIAQFARTHEVVTLFGGILEGKFIDAAKVKELSALPSKQQLLGQLVGTLNAPISGFVNVLAGNLRNLVGVLNNIKQSKAA